MSISQRSPGRGCRARGEGRVRHGGHEELEMARSSGSSTLSCLPGPSHTGCRCRIKYTGKLEPVVCTGVPGVLQGRGQKRARESGAPGRTEDRHDRTPITKQTMTISAAMNRCMHPAVIHGSPSSLMPTGPLARLPQLIVTIESDPDRQEPHIEVLMRRGKVAYCRQSLLEVYRASAYSFPDRSELLE